MSKQNAMYTDQELLWATQIAYYNVHINIWRRWEVRLITKTLH